MKKKGNEEKIIRVKSKDLKNLKGNTDWEKVDKLTDAMIEHQIAVHHDAAEALATEWFRKATWVKPKKKGINLRLDSDILTFFKSQGSGYQTRINQVLRAFVEAHRQTILTTKKEIDIKG